MSNPQDTRIAELERENTRLRELLNDREMPSTLRHQVRNALGLMRAILRRSAETSANVEEYAAHAEGRFDAMLRVQSLLIASLDHGVSLHSLVAEELVAHVIHEGAQATIEGPPVVLGPKSAQVLGLAFHELAVNAIKFGAMTSPAGRIAVRWTLLEDASPELTLVWSETGAVGLKPPEFRGFGVEALENMLRYEIDAKSVLEFRSDGLHCAILLPLAKSRR